MPKTKRITKKAKKAMTKAVLHIHDELPRIGSGVRHVLVRKKTKSYVWLLYNDTPMRVKRDTYDLVCTSEDNK